VSKEQSILHCIYKKKIAKVVNFILENHFFKVDHQTIHRNLIS